MSRTVITLEVNPRGGFDMPLPEAKTETVFSRKH